MASEVQIINEALGELGEPEIVSRSDNTPQANAADRFFDNAKKQLLEDGKWRFAAKYSNLGQIATAPAFKYAYQYQLPSDFIRLIELNEVDVDNVTVPLHERVQDALYTDETSAKIVYVSDVDVSQFSPGAARALSFMLASKMARLLTDSATQKQEMLDEYRRELKSAKSIDSMHQRQPIENRAAYSKFVIAQNGGGFPNPTVEPTAY